MLSQHTMHRFVAHDLCQVIDALGTAEICEGCFANVERARLAILTILKVAAVVFAVRDRNRSYLSFLNRIA